MNRLLNIRIALMLVFSMTAVVPRQVDHSYDPVLTRMGHLGLETVGGYEIGFIAREKNDFGETTWRTLEEEASGWDELGITPATRGEGGDSYYLKRDDETLKRMISRYAGHQWPEVRAALRARYAGRRQFGVNRDIDSTKIGGIPITFDPQWMDLAIRDMVMQENIRRMPVDNKRVDWDTLPTRAVARWATEGTTIAAQDDIPEEQTINIKLMYGRVTLSGLGQRVASGAKRINLLTQRVQSRITAMMELLEQTTLTGDGTGGSFLGFENFLDTNVLDLATTVIDLDDITELQKKCWKSGGGPTMGIASHDVVAKIGALQEDKARVIKEVTTVGISGWDQLRNVVIHNGMPIFGSRFMDDTADDMEMYLLQTSVLSYATLLDFTLVPLGAEANDTESWLIKAYIALRDLSANDTSNNDGTGGQFHGRMHNIAVV